MPNSRNHHVGLVGCGGWGQHILRDLRALGCAVTVVANGPATAQRAEAGGADRIVAAIDELRDVAGVVIATPAELHVAHIREVLPFGVPIFVEKPLADNESEAISIAALTIGRVFVMDKWRYHPGVEALAEVVRSRTYGRLLGIDTVRRGWSLSHEGDAVWALAPHDLSIALEIAGALAAPLAAVAHRENGVLTGLQALLRHADGWWHSIDASIRSPQQARRIEVHLESALAVLGDSYDSSITIYQGVDSKQPTSHVIPIGSEAPLLAELRAFVDHLGGGPEPRSSVTEAASIVTTVTALRSLAGVE